MRPIYPSPLLFLKELVIDNFEHTEFQLDKIKFQLNISFIYLPAIENEQQFKRSP